MSTLGKHRLPMFARPWAVALAITLGVIGAALAGYVLEPIAMPTKTAHAMRAPAVPGVMRSPETASRVELPIPATIILEEVVIAAPSRRPAQVTTQADACEPSNWRLLETGPATRQVRDFCPIPNASLAQPPPSIRHHFSSNQHLTAPRIQHNALGTADEPGRVDSIHTPLHAK